MTGLGGNATGRNYEFRRGEILVATKDLALVADALQKERAQLVRHLQGMALFRVPTESDVVAVVERLRSLEGEPLVAPNRVFQLTPHVDWDPATAAEPVEEELPPLPEQDGRLPGTGVRVGIVDTGLLDHPWLEGRAQRARGDADLEELHERDPEVFDFEAGHGTFVAGIVLQCAPGAEVFVYGVDDKQGRLDHASLNDAIDFLVRQREVDILNFSFGGFAEDSADDVPLLRETLRRAGRHNPDLVMVAAAGNHEDPANPEPGRFFPAAERDVIGVGALDRTGDQMAGFSNDGDWVDCVAIGDHLLSTHLLEGGLAFRTPAPNEGDDHTHAEPVVEKVDFQGYARWSGTSFSAPLVAGAIAARMSPDGTRRSAEVAVREVVPRAQQLAGAPVKAIVPRIAGLPRT